MDARTYLDTHGTAGAEALVAAVKAADPEARITVGYFKQIAYGYRSPSYKLGKLMVQHDPQRALELDALMSAKEAKGSTPASGEGSHAAQ